jgi:hypothetical protein
MAISLIQQAFAVILGHAKERTVDGSSGGGVAAGWNRPGHATTTIGRGVATGWDKPGASPTWVRRARG